MVAFVDACRDKGVRVTHQRAEIYREVIATGGHPDVETIYRRVKKHIPTVALDTVYRNLKFLAEHDLIDILGTTPERLRFDTNILRHHHFVCVRCGSIKDFNSKQLSNLTAPREAKQFGKSLSVQLEVKGICAKCQTKQEQ